MEAAIPAVMFSGILETQMERESGLADLFGRLNQSAVRSRRGRSFVCFSMAEIALNSRSVTFANAACPYPYIYRSATGTIEEVQIDSYPLGIREGITFETHETELSTGDYVIFCSNGIIEADNEAGEQFGYEATSRTLVELCSKHPSSEELIDQLLARISDFRGSAPQSDDMTCVVLKAV